MKRLEATDRFRALSFVILSSFVIRHSSFPPHITHHASRSTHATSIKHPRMDIGPMHRRMAAGAPTSALPQVGRVRSVADVDFSWRHARSLHLRVALEAEVGIAFDEHLAIDRAVRIVANGAAFAQGLMLEDKRPSLLAMALRAILIEPRHGQPARGLGDVGAMRIVALHAIHVAFEDGMMLG